MRLLPGSGVRRGIDKERHAMMQRHVGFKLRERDARAIAEFRQKLRLLVQERAPAGLGSDVS
jgi:hypothetical protein